MLNFELYKLIEINKKRYILFETDTMLITHKYPIFWSSSAHRCEA